jgi:hypothetical protein
LISQSAGVLANDTRSKTDRISDPLAMVEEIVAGRGTLRNRGRNNNSERISVPSWMCRVWWSFETSRSVQEAPKFTLATVSLSEMADLVSDAVILQYVGFETKGAVREYTFTLRGAGGESSKYFVTIANDAFVAHRVRYQDAPDICSLRLHRECATQTDHPSSTRFCVTDAELADYRDAHTPKPRASPYIPRENKDS